MANAAFKCNECGNIITVNGGHDYDCSSVGKIPKPVKFNLMDIAQGLLDVPKIKRFRLTAKERHEVYSDLGMKRVRGSMGGVYYE